MQIKVSLRRSALMLALAGSVEFGLQMAMPMILVRHLDQAVFGQYRMLWLMASTALALAPAFMPQSLFYFLSRSDDRQRTVYVGNALLYLLVAGAVVGAIASLGETFLPLTAVRLFAASHGLSAVFLAIWVVASMLDVLPTADGNARWQAGATMSLAMTRMLLLSAVAILAGSVISVVLAMLVLAALKLLLLLFYVHGISRSEQSQGFVWQMSALKRQLAYAIPFALGNALFLLRVQADEWVVATMLPPAQYAIFSVAAVVLPIATLVRQPVYNAMMPYLNNACSRSDHVEIGRLIAKTNGATSLLLIPVVGGLLVAAPELVRIVYTARYEQTTPVMQVYLVGMMFNAFAVGHVLSALGKGRFALINNACCLAVSVVVSIIGVRYIGMIGAALGSVMMLGVSELWSLQVVAAEIGLSIRRLLPWRSLLPVTLATAAALICVDALSPLVSLSLFPMLLFKGSIYLGAFIPCFLLTGGVAHLDLLLGLRAMKKSVIQEPT